MWGIKFFIAGRNSPDTFSNKIRRFRNVIFQGEVENGFDFISSKSIMIIPLFAGSGMRIKIIEGMALGKAIISTTMAAEGIESTHEKNILIADTKDEFINETERLIQNKDLADRISKNAQEFVKQNFDNKKITLELLDFYKNYVSQ